MATDSPTGKVKLAVENEDIANADMPITELLAAGYTTVTPGTYTIQPGNDLRMLGEATFECDCRRGTLCGKSNSGTGFY